MKSILFTFVALLLVPLASLCAAERQTRGGKPNIVFILADDLGYGDVQCYNPQRGKIATPHVDRLAAQGMAFTDAHSSSSVCTPTRYGIITGRCAWRTKLQSGAYGDFVMETDWALGAILSAIDKNGVADNTLVIFTSDNGCAPYIGVDKLEKQGHFPSANLRGYKTDIWDGGHRIPFIARWPGVVKPGSACGQLTCLTDLMATCADIVGAKLPDNAGEDSVSILPLLKGQDQPVREAVVHHSISGAFALRQGNNKLIFGPGSGGWSKGGNDKSLVQLYDMVQDVGERQNRHAADAPKASASPPTLEGTAPVSDGLGTGFQSPPPAARPWVYWFWINGNISKPGITADLEAMKRVGVGGVLWMEVSGPVWAPDGKVMPLSPQWHEAFQWAVRECERLGIQFDVSLDFGYGSGGPHVTPELSMQRLVWSEQEVEGGQPITVALEKPQVKKQVSAWLRPGAKINAAVLQALEQSDSYRDVAVVAVPLPVSQEARAYRIAGMDEKAGLHSNRPARDDLNQKPATGAVTPAASVIDLTGRMDREGRLTWDAPPGKWLVTRMGYASNFKMTRPCPQAAVGLECNRLSRAGIDAHFNAFLKKIIEGASRATGGTLAYAHIDSWEAGGQNWTASFPAEFRSLRGYDLRPWLPVLTGRVVGSEELSERFLWDVRTTVSEMIRDNYARRLRELLRAHGMKLSIEAYGDLCIDNLSYAGISDMPIGEFWAMGDGVFPAPGGGYDHSSKAMASAAHIYGKPIVGAEAFTSGRGWRDHPFLLKGMGDKAFCRGVNRMIFHLSAHQPYENMIPGLTHRKWGEHFHRHNTWWDYSRVWTDYLSRCQYLLQQGEFVADVCYWFGEGAPLSVNDMTLEMPDGYDYDLCSSEIVLQMKVRGGRLVLPSGMSYRYLLLPDTDRMTLPLANKIRELVDGGARVVGGKRPKGSPGLTDYPQCDAKVEEIAAALWDAHRVASGRKLAEVFRQDGLKPDFEGSGLSYIHRRVGEADVYFVSHQQEQPQDIDCTFRAAGRIPELWDPEAGSIRELPDFSEKEGRIRVPLHFEAMQSWFIVFRKRGGTTNAGGGKNFAAPRPLRELTGKWQVTFDPKWGGPNETVVFEKLTDWSRHSDPRIRYYSGTAVYRKTFELAKPDASAQDGRLWLDLGKVDVMARVRLNAAECGIAWKPPYRVDITRAIRPGKNELEIDMVNLWINRMIGDEQLPEDGNWLNFETLAEWPDWFKAGTPRPSGRYTFTSCKHYKKDSPLVPSGLLGPVKLQTAGDLK